MVLPLNDAVLRAVRPMPGVARPRSTPRATPAPHLLTTQEGWTDARAGASVEGVVGHRLEREYPCRMSPTEQPARFLPVLVLDVREEDA